MIPARAEQLSNGACGGGYIDRSFTAALPETPGSRRAKY
jgi:hypothetical protein